MDSLCTSSSPLPFGFDYPHPEPSLPSTSIEQCRQYDGRQASHGLMVIRDELRLIMTWLRALNRLLPTF